MEQTSAREWNIFCGYNLIYSNNKDPESIHTQTFGPNTFSYSVDVLGGVIYQFYVRAVTIKPGTNTSFTVNIPQYGKRVFFLFYFVLFCFFVCLLVCFLKLKNNLRLG